jgi:mono/diheme cytochrome c family protein
MKALKLGLVVSLAAIFFVACSTDTPNNNATTGANQNASSAGVVAPPATSGNATANANAPSGPGSSTGNPPAPATNANAAAAAASRNSNSGAGAGPNIDAAALFVANKCTGCHGADGKGNPNIKDVPNFADAAWQKKTPDAEMINAIRNGDKPMPAYKDKLNEQEIRALVAYVRTFAK